MAQIILNKTIKEQVEIDLKTPIYRTYLGSLHRKYFEENGEVRMVYVALGRNGGLTVTDGSNEIQEAIECKGHYQQSTEHEFKEEVKKLLVQLDLI